LLVQDVPSHAEEDVFVRGVCEVIKSTGDCISVSSLCLALAAYSCYRAVLAVSSRHSLISAMMRASSYYDKQVTPPRVNLGEDPIARHKRRFHIDRLPMRVEIHQGPVPLVAGPSSHVNFGEDTLAHLSVESYSTGCRMEWSYAEISRSRARSSNTPGQRARSRQPYGGHHQENVSS
jgi:hypothetical protein